MDIEQYDTYGTETYSCDKCLWQDVCDDYRQIDADDCDHFLPVDLEDEYRYYRRDLLMRQEEYRTLIDEFN